jgi:hypothetical protein
MRVQLLGIVSAPQMVGRLVQGDLAEPSPESQRIAQCVKLPPRPQKNLLCQIVYVPRWNSRHENRMHHAKEPAVQFGESAIVPGARRNHHIAQFAFQLGRRAISITHLSSSPSR